MWETLPTAHWFATFLVYMFLCWTNFVLVHMNKNKGQRTIYMILLDNIFLCIRFSNLLRPQKQKKVKYCKGKRLNDRTQTRRRKFTLDPSYVKILMRVGNAIGLMVWLRGAIYYFPETYQWFDSAIRVMIHWSWNNLFSTAWLKLTSSGNFLVFLSGCLIWENIFCF